MMGYSWSGFNCLQVAAQRPPALKAIASIFASDDRYADDVHYRGGLVMPDGDGALVDLHARLAGAAARPRGSSAIAGARCGSSGSSRRRGSRTGSPHQRRDAYWQQGSVRDDYGRIECPVLCVAGWTDGYTDAAFRLMEGLDVPRHALIGPWGHHDPIRGVPGPAVGILGELVRWWRSLARRASTRASRTTRWSSPTCRTPWFRAPTSPSDPGRYVGEESWPSPRIAPRTLALGDGTLGGPAPVGGTQVDRQRPDRRARGRGLVRRRAVRRPAARPAWRGRALADLHLGAARRAARDPGLPRGAARRRIGSPACARLGPAVRGAARRRVAARDARPAQPLPPPLACRAGRVVPGEEVEVTVRMDSIGHRFPAGSRIRLSVSPCYWPLAWPSPEPVTLTLRHGGTAALVLPERPPRRRGRSVAAARRAGGAGAPRHDAAARRLGRLPADRARPRERAHAS